MKKNFKFIKWNGDTVSARRNRDNVATGKIRLTEYAVFHINGSYSKSKKYSYALYSIINDNFKRRVTKQRLLSGVLDQYVKQKKIKPLVWVSRDGLEESLMQGTTIVKMPNNKLRVFSVDKDNEIEYDKKIKDRRKQKRYWYFKESKKSKKFGGANILNLGKTVFAGDIYNIGLGKIIAIRYKNQLTKKMEWRLGILADTGGAFLNNLYQLDFYSGIFKSRSIFNKWRKIFPNNVQAYILVKV